MSLVFRFAVALVAVTGLMLGTADAQKVASLSALAIEATNGTPAKEDPSIPKDVLGELKGPFPFNQWKSLGTFSGSPALGQTWSTPLGGSGYTFTATPQSIDGDTITFKAVLLQGGSEIFNSTLRLQRSRVVVSKKVGAGGIFVVITSR